METVQAGKRKIVSHPASVFLGDPQPWAAVHISHKEVRNSKGIYNCVHIYIYVRIQFKREACKGLWSKMQSIQ